MPSGVKVRLMLVGSVRLMFDASGPVPRGLAGPERMTSLRVVRDAEPAGHRTAHGRRAVRAAWTSRVSWRVSSTLAGLRRETSRPWQQAMTWSITAA
jgi:hypothetical protein